ncbi:MAG: LytTR family transcriptional regulator [Rhodobacteraceae bacterium]|nr:LytTR family transcriptional regulator [Paracoccaceae bacterium]
MVGAHRPELVDVLKVVALVVVFTPVLIFLTNTLVPENTMADPEFIVYAQSVAIVSAAICIARRVLPGFEEVPYGKAAKHVAEKPEPIVVQPRLTRRLPSDFEGPILRLAVRDHFVDVVTAQATHTIRLRFLDAIDEMDNVEGYCTHRSHWVARDAIIRAERIAGRIFLRIVNQDLVPVSRKCKTQLESVGVI